MSDGQAKQWRERADELRGLSGSLRNLEAQRILLDLIGTYEELAKEAEESASRNDRLPINKA